MRTFFLLMLLFSLSVSSAFAQVGFEARIMPEEQRIFFNETAIYELILSHDSLNEEIFEVYSPNVIWDLRASEILKVPPRASKGFSLFLRPLNVNPGFYGVPVHIRLSGTNTVVKKNLIIELVSPLPPKADYLPAVRGVVSINENIDPREEVVVTLSLKNQNVKKIDKIDVKLRSNVINNDYTTALEPLEEKTITYSVKLDPLTAPQDDVLRVALITQAYGKTFQFDMPPAAFGIGVFRNLEEALKIEKAFLKSYKIITLTNKGNTPIDEPYGIATSFLKNIFTSTEPKAGKSNNLITWDLRLDSGESTQIIVIYNYRPLLVVIALIILAIVFYYLLRSPLVILKRASVVGTHEGGISDLKVVLQLVNRGSRILSGISLIDLVPRIADVLKEEQSTLRPVNVVKHDRKGTIVKWYVEKMAPGEQRIITYKIKSKLSILGGVTLPVAVARFDAAGRKRTTSSNAPLVGFGGQ